MASIRLWLHLKWAADRLLKPPTARFCKVMKLGHFLHNTYLPSRKKTSESWLLYAFKLSSPDLAKRLFLLLTSMAVKSLQISL